MIVPFIAVGRYFILNNYKPANGLPKKCLIMRNHFMDDKLVNHSFRNFFSGVRNDFEQAIPSYKCKSYIVLFWTKHLPLITKLLKSNSVCVAKNCVEQIEYVVAQRIRRSQQMIALYTRLWDEKGLRLLFQRMKRMFHKRSRHFMLGASLLAFNWDNERISIDELKRHSHEMNICHILRQKAFHGIKSEGTESHCSGVNCPCPDCDATSDVHCWEPFVKEEDLTVWKMEDPSRKGTGLYCYKVYGKYSDVTADDFLEVFLDTENRTQWDVHAADLKVIDSETSSQSDVIYWETKWPVLFSNRDYVFKRRYFKDEENKVIIIMNKSTEHPMYPPSRSKARVTEYWSYMVIKPKNEFDEAGIEFSLTYFDNPGTSLPSAISLWVTVQGIPEYLKRLRVEAIAISEKRNQRKKESEVVEPTPTPTHKLKRCCKDPSIPPSPPTEHETPISVYDYVFIFSSYMQKIKTSLWL